MTYIGTGAVSSVREFRDRSFVLHLLRFFLASVSTAAAGNRGLEGQLIATRELRTGRQRSCEVTCM